jgi:hypothetical protein
MVKSPPTPHFYDLVDAPADPCGDASEGGPEGVLPTSWTAGPWTAAAQHGGPPSALLGRAVERLAAATGGGVVGRISVDLLGPVAVGPLSVTASVLRPGRSVRLLEATLHDVASDRSVAVARAWVLPARDDGPGEVGPPPPHGPEDGVRRPRPPSWSGGYLDAVDWRWVRGGLDEPGTGEVWMRSPRLVAGEETSPLQRVLACVDSASGVSAALDIADWAFLNTELTVHVLRPAVGEWVCLDAATTLGPGSVAVATSTVHDAHGLVARSAQTLLVVRR